MKKKVFYRETKGDLVIEKRRPKFPDLIFTFFHSDNGLILVTINSSVGNLIMGKLWKAVDPAVAHTVTFSFHWTLKQNRLTNNHIKHVPVQSL